METVKLQGCDIAWCVRRLPLEVMNLFKQVEGGGVECSHLMLAGGWIRACIANEEAHDVDLFVSSKQDGINVAAYLLGKAREKAGDNAREIVTDNAITIIGFAVPVQIIHRWTWDDPLKMIESFDFTVSCAVIWFEHPVAAARAEWKGIACDRFYADLAAKRLVYLSPVREEEAGGSLMRVMKFAQRGYRIPLESLAAVIARVSIAVKWEEIRGGADGRPPFTKPEQEEQASKVICGLLREVDPNISDREFTTA